MTTSLLSSVSVTARTVYRVQNQRLSGSHTDIVKTEPSIGFPGAIENLGEEHSERSKDKCRCVKRAGSGSR